MVDSRRKNYEVTSALCLRQTLPRPLDGPSRLVMFFLLQDLALRPVCMASTGFGLVAMMAS